MDLVTDRPNTAGTETPAKGVSGSTEEQNNHLANNIEEDEGEQHENSEAATEDELPETSQNGNTDDAGHATDSTLSDAENADNTLTGTNHTQNANANDDATESESSDIELDLDEIDQDFNCKWQTCDEILGSPTQLTKHVFSAHAKDQSESELLCHWEACSLKFINSTTFTNHIRSHTQDYPYFCPNIECTEKFASAIDLGKHSKDHSDNASEEKYAWQSFLNEIVATDYPHLPEPTIENDNVLKRFRCPPNSKALKDHVQKPKIDFLKIQNIQIDDIVSEPIKRKGRTANSVINADLRSAFKEIDDAYKEQLIKATQDADLLSAATDIEQLPTFETINSLKHVDQLNHFHDSLHRKLIWGLEAQSFLKKDLDELKYLERDLWNKKELLFQANINLEIPKEQQNYL